MVQTYQSPVRVYRHPFEMVMAAYEKRFPTCHLIPIFVGSEILEEIKSPDGAEHTIERKCQLNVDAPYILKKIAGVDFIYFSQKNSVDWRKRTLNIEATNLSFSTRVVVKECCNYYVHPDNPGWTCFEQTASLDVKSFFGFEGSVEKVAVKHYATNIAKGKEIIEHYLAELISEGTTHIPSWQQEHPEEGPANDNDSAISQVSSLDASDELYEDSIDAHLSELDGDHFDSPNQHPPDSFPEKAPPSGAGSVGAQQHHHHRHQEVTRSDSSTSKQGARKLRSGAPPSLVASKHEQEKGPPVGAAHALRHESIRRRKSLNTGPPVDESPLSRSRSGTVTKETTPGEEGERLEVEYIHRFLGELTPLEESRLCELRYWLHDTHKGKLPNDAHLLRFLRACDFEVAKAREMVLASMMWRKQHQVDAILSTYHPPPVLLQFFAGAWHHHDLEGRPIFVLRLGQLDIKGLLKAVGEDGIVKFVLSICEEGLKRTEEATMKFGKPISSWTLLMDMEGLSMRHLWRPGLKTLLKIIEIAESNYPETMGLALVVRAPRVFPVLWTFVGPLINENTRNKFMIYGGNDYEAIGGLTDYMAAAYIPDFLGKAAFCMAPEGGLVPKSLYSLDGSGTGVEKEDGPQPGEPGVDEDPSARLVLESLYTKAHVYKGLPHEVLIPILEKGSVLTWDFDILKGHCEFQVLRTSKIIEPELVATNSPSSVLSPTGIVAAIAASTPVHFNKHLQLGLDLFLEQSSTQCSEGDSVQGSHYCSTRGTYVLQWRHPDHHPHSSSTFDFELPVPTQKSKLMYFYDVINAESFKGSMISLESCRSSFSSLSLATSPSSPTVSEQSRTLRMDNKCGGVTSSVSTDSGNPKETSVDRGKIRSTGRERGKMVDNLLAGGGSAM